MAARDYFVSLSYQAKTSKEVVDASLSGVLNFDRKRHTLEDICKAYIWKTDDRVLGAALNIKVLAFNNID